MKKLSLLIAILTLSLSGFSQTDTTKVSLWTQYARWAAKELVDYDYCKEEVESLQKQKALLVQDTARLSDQVDSLKGWNELLKTENGLEKKKIQNLNKENQNLNELYKKKSSENEWWKYGTIGSVICLTLKLIFG